MQLFIDCKINRMYHRYRLQTEKSLPEGKWIMLETRLPRFRYFPLTRGLGFLGLHPRPMFDYFFSYGIKNYYLSFVISFIFDILRRITANVIRCVRSGAKMTSLLKFRVLTSLLTSRVSDFPAPLKIEQTLSHM